eukprot:gene1960-biopygen1264
MLLVLALFQLLPRGKKDGARPKSTRRDYEIRLEKLYRTRFRVKPFRMARVLSGAGVAESRRRGDHSVEAPAGGWVGTMVG